MAKRFGAQHGKNGYAAMGGNKSRPIYAYANRKRSVADAIAHARNVASRQAAATKKK